MPTAFPLYSRPYRRAARSALAALAATVCLFAGRPGEAAPALALDAPSAATVTVAATHVPTKRFTIAISAAGRVIGGSYAPFVVDTTGAETSGATEVSTRLSLSGHLDSNQKFGVLQLEAQVGLDIARGTVSGKETLAGDAMPGTTFDSYLPTDAWLGLRYSDKMLVRVGQMTSSWGLGLIANDGKGYMDARQQDWFVRSETGDRVMRALVLARPFAGTTSALRGWIITGAIDRVVADDVLLQPDGQGANLWNDGRQEEAVQGIVATRFFVSKQSSFGLYYVYRDQEHKDGNWLKVHAVDAAADLHGKIGKNKLRIRGEAVLITGKTSLSATPDFPEHDVRQAAIAAQGRLTMGRVRLEFDTAWLSGDNNFDDGTLTQFKADPNYQLGLVLFPRVLGAWSGRSRLTASNPDVVGVPNEDLERLATQGAVTSTMAFFPKIGVQLPFGLDIYGGALFAFAPTPVADPFHTKTSGGGVARNALNKPQGPSLGIELDFGVRYTLALPMQSALVIAAEYGLLLPGDALAGLDANVHGGRLSLTFAPDFRDAK